MSKVKDNIVTTGLSGKLGKQIVFRQWDGCTILAKAPERSKVPTENELVKKRRLRFKEATVYAKKAIDNPELSRAYKSKCKARQNAYNRAIQDFYSAPTIGEIDLSNCTSDTDSFVRVYATDDFLVKQVRIRIENKQGDVIESGLAEREGDTDWWKFVVTAPNILSKGGKVIVSAFDLPGNEATSETERRHESSYADRC